jgi:tetratricopeptide (TPR) repeat protein
MLALAQVAAGNNTLALASARDAVARSPKLGEAAVLQSELELQSGDTVGAIAGLKAYLEQVPKDPRGWEALGKAQLRTRDMGGAQSSFDKVVELAPQNARGAFLVGVSLRAQGKSAEAKQQFEKALAMAPGFVEPLDQLAAMSLAEKKPQERSRASSARPCSIRSRRDPVPAGPRLPGERRLQGRGEGLQEVGRAQPERGARLRGARPDLRRLEGVRPGDRRARQGARLAARPAGGADAEVDRAADEGRQREGREGYEKLLKANPRFAPAGNNLAWMLTEDGPGQDLKRAMLLAQAARDAAPQDPQIADTLGWVHYKQGAYPGGGGAAARGGREAARQPGGALPPRDGAGQARPQRGGARLAREEPRAVGQPPGGRGRPRGARGAADPAAALTAGSYWRSIPNLLSSP